MLHLSAEMGNSVCHRFHMEKVVCPPTLRGDVFTTAAVDNIDHNPSATTAKDSLHGTAISLLQHPSYADEGVDRGVVIIRGNATSRAVTPLPHFYTDVPPITSVKQTAIPPTSLVSLKRTNFKSHTEGEYEWLENTRKVLEGSAENSEKKLIVGCIPCQQSGTRKSSYHSYSLIPPIPGECSYCGYDSSLDGYDQECC